jgi:FKBP-type peptidyl-prolyl cis-trans isomerase
VLVENYLYYKQIRGGDGSKISLNKPVKVAYALKSVSGFVFTESKEGEWLDLKRTYRGFREGFPQMSIGEKGVLYIHPEWGFKSYLAAPHFSPYLIAEFELLSQ